MKNPRRLIEKLETLHALTESEYALLIQSYTEPLAAYAAQKAVALRKKYYSNSVYIRGLIEIGNYCKNNCLYCGIRRDNTSCERYRLTETQILDCCDQGYPLGFRTFVLQGGEDGYYTDMRLCKIIDTVKNKYPDCAVTLSLGERTRQSYQTLYNAGADRYLLRHETADAVHYDKLHPPEQSFVERMRCLYDLQQIGYQTGCGFMVGSPGQTTETLAKDLKFIETFHPAMCGIGPFIPHHATPFADKPAGPVGLTCYLLSLIRLIQPNILLPATTALSTLLPDGRERGVLAGANVVMPNLSPMKEREKYTLYDNKRFTEEESAQNIARLRERINAIGYEVVTARGDIAKK